MIIAVSCGVRETKTSSGMLDTNSLVTYFNELINENTKKMKYPIGERVIVAIGWIAISPFILRDFIIFGFKWLVKKIKRK